LAASAFHPCPLAQIHATIIGLEGRADGGRVIGELFHRLRGEIRAIDFHRLLSLLRARGLLPMSVQIGGFAAGTDYAFRSRGEHPHLRSFSIQQDTAVCVGWPVEGSRLDALRRRLQEANVLHKYHARPGDTDNDLFFALGRFAHPPEAELVQSLEARLRRDLASRAVSFTLRAQDLQIVSYVSTDLPAESSHGFPITGPSAITETELHVLY
jgi:hypothetical protein